MKKKSSSSMFYIYFLYALVLTAAALYFRFPAAKFKAYCERQVEQSFEYTDCNIGEISYVFPRSMVWTGVEINRKVEEFSSRLVVNEFTVKPGLTFWNSFSLSGSLYSGSAAAKLKIDRGEKQYSLRDIDINHVDFGKLYRDQGITNRAVSGTLDASGRYKGSLASPTRGEGKLRFTLENGKYDLLQPILSLSTINFDKINFDLTVGEQLDIQQGKMKGAEMNAEFSGNLNPAPSFPESRLKFTGLLEPQADFLQGHPREARMVKQYARRYKRNALPFILGGSVSNPTFRFSR